MRHLGLKTTIQERESGKNKTSLDSHSENFIIELVYRVQPGCQCSKMNTSHGLLYRITLFPLLACFELSLCTF